MDRLTFIPGMLLALIVLASTGVTAQETARGVTKGTIVGREPSGGAWLLEFDHGVDTTAGRVRTVRLLLDEKSGPAEPLRVGSRIEADGRVLGSPLGQGLANFEPGRIKPLADPGLRHAYFLFRRGRSEGCAECYIPLLLTTEAIGASATAPDVDVIVTFERDSIWTIPDGISITEVEPRARTLSLGGRPYRYQEVSLEEPIRLLTAPLGSIPVSRLWLPDSLTETRLRALLLRLGVRPQANEEP